MTKRQAMRIYDQRLRGDLKGAYYDMPRLTLTLRGSCVSNVTRSVPAQATKDTVTHIIWVLVWQRLNILGPQTDRQADHKWLLLASILEAQQIRMLLNVLTLG